MKGSIEEVEEGLSIWEEGLLAPTFSESLGKPEPETLAEGERIGDGGLEGLWLNWDKSGFDSTSEHSSGSLEDPTRELARPEPGE